MAGKKKTPEKPPRGVFENTPGRGVWYVRYFDQFGRRQRFKVGTYEDAVAEHHTQKRLVAQERNDPESVIAQVRGPRVPGHRRVPIKPVTRDWDHKQRHGKLWKDALGEYALADVTPQMIERWRTKRLREVSSATVSRGLTFRKRVLNVCLRNGTAEKNPFAHIGELRENNARVRLLADDEQGRLMAALPAWAVLVVLVAIGAGTRVSEQLNLLWENVDFANEVITIPRGKQGGKRHIPMSEEVVEILRELPGRMRSTWVFPRPSGKAPLTRNGSLRGALEKALAEPGIANFHWHDLRYTFASRLAMAGVGLLDIKELMGHKPLVMVQRYAHLSSDHLRQAVAKIRVRGPAEREAAGAAREESRSQA